MDRHDIAEPVDDKSGQPVRLGVDKPVKRLIEKPLAQGQGTLQPCPQEAFVDYGVGIAVENPKGDQGMGIDGADAKRLAVDAV